MTVTSPLQKATQIKSEKMKAKAKAVVLQKAAQNLPQRAREKQSSRTVVQTSLIWAMVYLQAP